MVKQRSSHTHSILAICIGLLLVLTLLISVDPLPSFDVLFMQKLQSLGSEKTLWMMELVSVPGNILPALVLALVVTFSLALSPLRLALIPLALVLPADLLSTSLKFLVDRPRPDPTLVAVHQVWLDPAFPSSHVVHYTVFFGFLAYLVMKTQVFPRRWRLPLASVAMVLVCLIPFSRMYLGAHWPTDVMGGLLLGISFLIIQIRVFNTLLLDS